MKFCDTLERQRKLSPVEWSASFLNYKLLKKKIKMMGNTQPEGHDTPSATTPEALASSQQEVEFFRMMDHEIRRGAQFLALSEGQYVIKTRIVLGGYQSTLHLLQSPRLGLEGMISDETATEMWLRLMDACTSVYRELLLLNHWVIVSYCGFSKILKKHDRWTHFNTKEKYMRHVVAKQHFTSYPNLHAMLRDMEALYTHISNRLPECPERAEAEAKMNAIKQVVALAAAEFSPHAEELARCIQEDHDRRDSSARSETDNDSLPAAPASARQRRESSPSLPLPRQGADRHNDKGNGVAEGEQDLRAGPGLLPGPYSLGGGGGEGGGDASNEARHFSQAAVQQSREAVTAAEGAAVWNNGGGSAAEASPSPQPPAAGKRRRVLSIEEENRAEIGRHQAGAFLPAAAAANTTAAIDPPAGVAAADGTWLSHIHSSSSSSGGSSSSAGIFGGAGGSSSSRKMTITTTISSKSGSRSGGGGGGGVPLARSKGDGSSAIKVATGVAAAARGSMKVGVTARLRSPWRPGGAGEGPLLPVVGGKGQGEGGRGGGVGGPLLPAAGKSHERVGGGGGPGPAAADVAAETSPNAVRPAF
ncbi:unnamed protein product [Ectocarpus sp. 4 AP-2014]